MERTLILIKPDAFEAGSTGKIIDMFLSRGFRLIAAKTARLCKQEAESFYEVHRDKFFFEGLTEFMCTGPLMAMVLEKENAIHDARILMGATNSPDAAPGTIRAFFGTDNRRNAVHGSDSPENASQEISFFFSKKELLR